jgi:hypothetical protein
MKFAVPYHNHASSNIILDFFLQLFNTSYTSQLGFFQIKYVRAKSIAVGRNSSYMYMILKLLVIH